MAETPTISVVIPAYNRETSIETAIRSTLMQTLPPTEVVVVDDGSTDATAARVQAMDDPRVRLITQENGGISAARNTGIREARGQWIAFQDSDDEWLPKKLERQFKALETMPDAIASYCGLLIIGTADKVAHEKKGPAERTRVSYHPPATGRPLSGQMLGTMMYDNPISTQTLMARRDTLLRVGLFDTKLKSLVDWDLGIRLASSGDISFVDEPLAIQHFSLNSITRDTEKRLQSWIYLLEKYQNVFADHHEAYKGHLVRIAGLNRKFGHHEQAANWYARARKLAPTDMRIWALSGLNALNIRR